MLCPNCSFENPANNKFCGECGSKLPAEPLLVNDYFQDRREVRFADPAVLASGPAEKQIASRSTNIAEQTEQRYPIAESRSTRLEDVGATPEYEFIDKTVRQTKEEAPFLEPLPAGPLEVNKSEEREVSKRSSGSESRYSGGISGPSLLGLNYGPAAEKPFTYDNDDQPATDAETDYLLDEVPQRTISWRAFAVLALLIGFAVLGVIQWRSQKAQQAAKDVNNILSQNGAAIPPGGIPEEPAPQPKAPPQAANPDSKPEAQNQAHSTEDQSGKAAENTPAATPAPSTASSPAQGKAETAATTNSPAQDQEGNDMPTSTATSPAQDKGVTVASNGPPPQEGVTVSSNQKPESDEETTNPVGKTNAGSRRSLTRARSQAAAATLGANDPKLARAQRFLQGRGVPQSCPLGLTLLRQSAAQGNPKADVQMGALYMSGHCVTQDRVAAYIWFSRALALEPQNQYIERNRASLYAAMTPQERMRVR